MAKHENTARDTFNPEFGRFLSLPPELDTNSDMELIELQWQAERRLKAARIRRLIAKGKYNVSSSLVARSLLNVD